MGTKEELSCKEEECAKVFFVAMNAKSKDLTEKETEKIIGNLTRHQKAIGCFNAACPMNAAGLVSPEQIKKCQSCQDNHRQRMEAITQGDQVRTGEIVSKWGEITSKCPEKCIHSYAHKSNGNFQLRKEFPIEQVASYNMYKLPGSE